MGLSFVPVTIARLAGVRRRRGIASGLVNTSRQIGGAIGLAAASAIAAGATSRYADAHGASVTSAAALDHGFRIALIVLTVVLLVGAAISAGLVRPAPRPVAQPVPAGDLELAKEAA